MQNRAVLINAQDSHVRAMNANAPVIAKIIPTTATWLTVELSCGHKAYNIPFTWDVGHPCRCITCEWKEADHFAAMARELHKDAQ